MRGAHLSNEDLQPLELRILCLNGWHVNVNVVFKRLSKLGGIDIASLEVIMYVDKVELAICADADEGLKVVETGGAPTIGDGRGAQ